MLGTPARLVTHAVPKAVHGNGAVREIEFDYVDAPVLVVGHSETLPAILELLGEASPPDIGPEEFGSLFIALPGQGVVARLVMP